MNTTTTVARQTAMVALSVALGLLVYAPRLAAMKAARNHAGNACGAQSAAQAPSVCADAAVSASPAAVAIPLFVRVGGKVQRDKADFASKLRVALYLESAPVF
jgi:hypothetical protein